MDRCNEGMDPVLPLSPATDELTHCFHSPLPTFLPHFPVPFLTIYLSHLLLAPNITCPPTSLSAIRVNLPPHYLTFYTLSSSLFVYPVAYFPFYVMSCFVLSYLLTFHLLSFSSLTYLVILSLIKYFLTFLRLLLVPVY